MSRDYLNQGFRYLRHRFPHWAYCVSFSPSLYTLLKKRHLAAVISALDECSGSANLNLMGQSLSFFLSQRSFCNLWFCLCLNSAFWVFYAVINHAAENSFLFSWPRWMQEDARRAFRSLHCEKRKNPLFFSLWCKMISSWSAFPLFGREKWDLGGVHVYEDATLTRSDTQGDEKTQTRCHVKEKEGG